MFAVCLIFYYLRESMILNERHSMVSGLKIRIEVEKPDIQ